jgi:hypothetical protein
MYKVLTSMVAAALFCCPAPTARGQIRPNDWTRPAQSPDGQPLNAVKKDQRIINYRLLKPVWAAQNGRVSKWEKSKPSSPPKMAKKFARAPTATFDFGRAAREKKLGEFSLRDLNRDTFHHHQPSTPGLPVQTAGAGKTRQKSPPGQ